MLKNVIFPHTLPVFPISANEYTLHKSETRNVFINPFFQQIFIGCLPLFRVLEDTVVNKSDKVLISADFAVPPGEENKLTKWWEECLFQ